MTRHSPVKSLAEAGHTAPSADNSQFWHFYYDGESLTINYDNQRVKGLTFPAWAPATLLSIGGVIENVLQAAEALELPIEAEILPSDSAMPDCYARFPLQDTGEPHRDLTGHAIFGRHTNRFRFNTKSIPEEIHVRLEQLSEGTARALSFMTRQEIKAVARLIQSATEVRFQTREIHEWLKASLRFSAADVKKADGLDVRTLDLPPGGRQFLKIISDWRHIRLLNKVGIYRMLGNIDAAPVKKAPAIVAIIGEDSTAGALDAGRLLSRIWIELNAQGLGVHPYFVVPDQIFRLKEKAVPEHLVTQIQDLEHETKRLFGLTDTQALYMLLRVGYPTKEAPRSLRLPLEKVFTDLSRSPQS